MAKRSTGKEEGFTSLAALMGMKKSEFAGVEAASGGGGFLPGRNQTARIEDGELTEGKTSGKPLIKWTLRGTCEANEGQVDFCNDMLVTAQNLSFARRQLQNAGGEWPDSVADLGSAVKEVIGTEIILDVVDKDEYHNLYFKDVVDGEAVEAPEDGKPETDEEPKDGGFVWDADSLDRAAAAADDDDDEDAQDALTECGAEYNLDPDDYETWQAYADAIYEEME